MQGNSNHSKVDRQKRRLKLESGHGRCSRCAPHSHENQTRSARGVRPSKDRK